MKQMQPVLVELTTFEILITNSYALELKKRVRNRILRIVI